MMKRTTSLPTSLWTTSRVTNEPTVSDILTGTRRRGTADHLDDLDVQRDLALSDSAATAAVIRLT
jgi:hypothetical protein